MIHKLWYAIRDAVEDSIVATFCMYAAFIQALLAAYVGLLTASTDYLDTQMTSVLFWGVLAAVAASIRAFRTHRTSKETLQ